MESFIKFKNADFYLSTSDANYINIYRLYGKTHTIEPVFGANVRLSDLKNGESVCYGDGKKYHFLLTEK